MKYTFTLIISSSLLTGNIMGSFITAKELNGLPGITESNIHKVLKEINEAEKMTHPTSL